VVSRVPKSEAPGPLVGLVSEEMPFLGVQIMRRIGILVVQVTALVISFSVLAQKNEIPRLQEGVLLVRTYLPDNVLLTTKDKTIALPDMLRHAFLSISSDGNIIGVVRNISSDSSQSPKHIISTYSVKSGIVTDYLEIHGFMGGFWGVSEVSPDGSKMAYVTRDARTDSSGAHLSLRVLDFETRIVSVITNPRGEVREISWSPDGRRIAFDMEPPGHSGLSHSSEIRTVDIVDIGSGAVSEIGLGGTPSWSPSGEWIAYVGYVPANRENSQLWSSYAGRYYAIDHFELRLMSTVGTHSRLLMRLHDGPNFKPIWSPDSQTLLLNQLRDADKATFDIYLVDLTTGKATKKFKDVAPVYGWVDAK